MIKKNLKYTTIIVAAGQGKRMQAKKNKIFLSVAGLSLIQHTTHLFLKDKDCKRILIVAREKEIAALAKIFAKAEKIEFVIGGDTRQESVYNAVKKLSLADKYVFIHDGARPFLKQAELQRLKEAMNDVKVALLGVPVQDTIKEVTKEAILKKTIPRQNLWRAQTPQAFSSEILIAVHQKAKQTHFSGTDDVSLVEEFMPGKPIKMVLGSFENIKITTPIDLLIGEKILENQSFGK